jgi:hypothetical protein
MHHVRRQRFHVPWRDPQYRGHFCEDCATFLVGKVFVFRGTRFQPVRNFEQAGSLFHGAPRNRQLVFLHHRRLENEKPAGQRMVLGDEQPGVLHDLDGRAKANLAVPLPRRRSQGGERLVHGFRESFLSLHQSFASGGSRIHDVAPECLM